MKLKSDYRDFYNQYMMLNFVPLRSDRLVDVVYHMKNTEILNKNGYSSIEYTLFYYENKNKLVIDDSLVFKMMCLHNRK